MEGYSVGIPEEFYHIASDGDAQPGLEHTQISHNQQFSPPLSSGGVVGLPVEGFTLHRPDILGH